MPIPTYEEVMYPLLRKCGSEPVPIGRLIAGIADDFGLTEDERGQLLPSGRVTVIASRVHWAKTYLKQAGLLAQPKRGDVVITTAGRALLASCGGKITADTLASYPSFQDFKARSRAERELPEGADVAVRAVPTDSALASPAVGTPIDRIDLAISEIETELQDTLLKCILESTPERFEALVVDLLVAMGYGGSHKNAGERLGRTGDGGVDGVIRQDRLGLERIYLQAKRYQPANRVGSPELRGFVGALHGQGAQRGVFITTSDFTADARSYTAQLGSMRIVLIGGAMLTQLMLLHGVGVRTERIIEIRKVDYDFFADAE